MTITIPRRLRENQGRAVVEIAERIPLVEIDTDPRVAGLLERRAAADQRHRQAVEGRVAKLELAEQARLRLNESERQIKALNSDFARLATRYAEGKAGDAELTAHRRALEGWGQKAEALRIGVAALDQTATDALRHGRPFADAVAGLDAEIETMRAVVALETAQRRTA